MANDELEELVILADAQYHSVDDKILYVNAEMGYIDGQGHVLPECKNDAMYERKFYRILGKIKSHTTEHFFNYAKDFRGNADIRYKKMLGLERKLLRIITKLEGNHKDEAAARVIKTWFEVQPFITSMNEALEGIAKEDHSAYEQLPTPDSLLP